MALPYPEGECFFKRSALHSQKSGGFNADDPAHFYSTMMIEVVWNREAHHGSKKCNENGKPRGHPHKRTDYKIVYATSWNTAYGNWAWLPITYGNARYPARRVKHELCTWGYRFYQREVGAAEEAWFMFVPMPTREEEWMWIDRLCCIRAIYIPAAYQSGPKYEELCTYIHVNFTQMKKISIEHQKRTSDGETDKDPRTIKCNDKIGLAVDEKTTLGINPARLITALVIPRDKRKVGALSSKSLILMDSDDIPDAPLTQEFNSQSMADWAKVVSQNQGLNIKWGEADVSMPWFARYFKNVLSFAIGYVPVFGPLLAIGTNLIMSAIFEAHEDFMDELREQLPTYDLTAKFVEIVTVDAENAKPMVKEDVPLKKKQDEKNYVEFDVEVLKNAQEAVEAKAKGEKGTETKKQSVFHTLDLSTLTRLARDNHAAIIQMLDPEGSMRHEWNYGDWDQGPDAKPPQVPEIPGDADGLADLFDELSKTKTVKYHEGWDVADLPVNKYGTQKEYMQAKEKEAVTIKK
ncbi:uncharacterized protein DSM5745_10384 [Aspergillus mulundensis]|uniref:Uncharacterized protein n=1 Tax=Aspergillus mulundensis TaxID=1810919 RepID=A0A3D8QIR4_9EURO|nr:hypothetical protein DSM5745_10384 [Aspergillus mulundensis]RDW61712.1 hypothetical protein DSM5745_10384 [Aspergillus mulundensis]